MVASDYDCNNWVASLVSCSFRVPTRFACRKHAGSTQVTQSGLDRLSPRHVRWLTVAQSASLEAYKWFVTCLTLDWYPPHAINQAVDEAPLKHGGRSPISAGIYGNNRKYAEHLETFITWPIVWGGDWWVGGYVVQTHAGGGRDWIRHLLL